MTTEELVLLFCLLTVASLVLTNLLQCYIAKCQRTYGLAWPRQHLTNKTPAERHGRAGLIWDRCPLAVP